METHFVLTVIGKDRPGLVDALAAAVAAHGGSWWESRMCHLSGEFAGILRVQVPSDQTQPLQEALRALESQGLQVVVRPAPGLEEAANGERAVLEIVGQDRPGIVHQVSRVLAAHGVNVEELETERSSAPMSGELLFRAHAQLRLPPDCVKESLQEDLERIGNDLQVDVGLRAESGRVT